MTGSIATEEEQREFAELCAFVQAFAARFWEFGPDHPLNPAAVSREMALRFGTRKALVGLRQAVNDMVEEAGEIDPAASAEFEQELLAAGSVSLTELQLRHSGQFGAIRERGHVCTESEFLLVKGVLDSTGPILDEAERSILETMLRKFETGRGD